MTDEEFKAGVVDVVGDIGLELYRLFHTEHSQLFDTLEHSLMQQRLIKERWQEMAKKVIRLVDDD